MERGKKQHPDRPWQASARAAPKDFLRQWRVEVVRDPERPGAEAKRAWAGLGGRDGSQLGDWIRWEEGGRLPDIVLEMLSPSTEKIDRNDKMKLYARVFRTREYFLYDFETTKLEGYRLAGDLYQPVRPDAKGWLRSEVLGVDLGLWEGRVDGETADWVRLFLPDGSMIPTPEERAQAAEAEVARLQALLREMSGPKAES